MGILGVEGENIRDLDISKLKRIWIEHYDAGVRDHIEYPNIPCYKLLESTAAKLPDKPAAFFFGNYITYAQLKQASDKILAFLSELGFQKGARAIVSLPNTPHYVTITNGIFKAGGVVVQCNPIYTTREIEFIARDSGAELMFCIDLMYPNIQPLLDQGSFRKVVTCSIQDFMPGMPPSEPPEKRSELSTYSELMKYQGTEKYAQIDPRQDLAMLQYTGGTTGTPKGVMLTHYNLVVNAYQCAEWDPKAGPNDIALGMLPVFHVYGMTMLNVGILLGMMIVPMIDPRWYQSALEFIQEFKITMFTAVPTMFVGMMEILKQRKYDLSSLRICGSGAAPLPPEVKHRWEELTGVRIAEGYGLSEASPVTHCNPLYGLNKPGSIGLPYPDTIAVVVDDQGTILPPGQAGELAIFGPQVMSGYWKKEAETRNVLINGWLLTGDIARMDEDGYFYIVDRKKDLIIAGGFNIYPSEVEQVLYEHPAILEAAVIGVPDPYRGESVKAFIQLKPEYRGKLAEEDLISYCREKLAAYKVPRIIEFRDELPKSLVGKILRRVLREEELSKAK